MSLFKRVFRTVRIRQYQTQAPIGFILEENDVVLYVAPVASDEESLVFTSPAYAHLPGNIFHESLYLAQLPEEVPKD